MAIETAIGGDGELFIGEDKRIIFGPLTTPTGWNTALQGVYSPPDLSLLTIVFVVRKKDSSDDPAIISREVDGFLGTYNSDVDVNTQQTYIDVTSIELGLVNFRVRSTGETYRWSVKVMDAPQTILGFGPFGPQQATAR
jgi:hypothetical protein